MCLLSTWRQQIGITSRIFSHDRANPVDKIRRDFDFTKKKKKMKVRRRKIQTHALFALFSVPPYTLSAATPNWTHKMSVRSYGIGHVWSVQLIEQLSSKTKRVYIIVGDGNGAGDGSGGARSCKRDDKQRTHNFWLFFTIHTSADVNDEISSKKGMLKFILII